MIQGASQIRQTIDAVTADTSWHVERASCLGLCNRAPCALVNNEPCGPLRSAVAEGILHGWRGDGPSYTQPRPGEVRVAMSRIGRIDPDSIDAALAGGAYQSLQKALELAPGEVLKSVTAAGLQGRGGAGFPTGRKWQMVADSQSPQKYVVCNADESEPGAFKDRLLMEGDPHLLLEGMAIAAYAVGASEGIVYVRGEYETSARRLETAIQAAQERGWLGSGIQKSPFDFTVHVHRGAGAYICGEETALLESLEGGRGTPRIRPPYLTTHGYLGRPTVVNNVETLCAVPPIVEHGPDWYRSMGTEGSAGTKIFTVVGHVKQGGAFEVPFGVTLRELIDQFAGGMRDGCKFKMALTGGAAGTIVPAGKLDVPLDYSSHTQGVSLGAGAVLVMDESVSATELLGWLLHFFEVESCGKCTPCREGTRQGRLIVDRLLAGRARGDERGELERLAQFLKTASLCGLGQSVAWPLVSTVEHFADELFPANPSSE